MDPDEALRRMREAIIAANTADEGGPEEGYAFREVRDYAQALDGWLRLGGFLPADWQRSGR